MGKIRDKIEQTKKEVEASKKLHAQGVKEGRWEKGRR